MAISPRGTVAHGLLALLCLMATGSVQADAALAKQKNCLNCHQAERKVVGPSWRAIGQRYAETPNAATALAVKIRVGGRGAWGVVPMPASPTVNEEEARRLAEWVLTHR
ncbi:hypothetical protein D621_19235 [beta proteobacterium AAP51]|nr:hypothetical protein D621_19235 [beta proteobacterium AAP51]